MNLPWTTERRSFPHAIALAFPIVLLALLVLVAGPGQPAAAPQQPIRFNHQVHVQQMTCIFCHRLYETQQTAGRPELSRCMLCHAYPVTSKPEAAKLQTFAQGPREIPWVRLTFLKPFAYFSHERHVVAGQVACASCHGAIAQTTAPPSAPLIPVTMQMCLDCHEAPAVQLAPDAPEALKTAGLDEDTVAAVRNLGRKRFPTGNALIAELKHRVGPIPAEEAGRIAGQVRPAAPVTVDCFACHR